MNKQNSMEQKEQNQNKKTVSRDDILLVALKLFAQKGYFNTSLADIKDGCGLKTTSAVYQHFKTKQSIAEALFDNILDSLSISIDDIRRRNRKSSEQLREIVDLLFKLTDDAPEVMTFLLRIKVDEFLPDHEPLLNTAPFNKIKRILQNGIKEGEIRSLDPLMAYACFFGIINQTLEMVLTGDLDKKADSYQSQVWLLAWNGIARK